MRSDVVEATLVEGQPAQAHRRRTSGARDRTRRRAAPAACSQRSRSPITAATSDIADAASVASSGMPRLSARPIASRPAASDDGERPAVTGDRLGGEDVDERADRAARAEVGLEVVEQRVGCGRAAQEPECRRDDPDEERGILGRALRPTDLPVAVEQRLAAGVALHAAAGRPRRCRRGAPARRRRGRAARRRRRSCVAMSPMLPASM